MKGKKYQSGWQAVEEEEEFSNVYSTEETAVGKWKDGKTLYRKVIPFNFPSNTTSLIAHNITNADRFTRTDGSWYDTEDEKWFCGDMRYDSNTVFIKINANDTNLVIEAKGTNWATRTNQACAILEYTKTTTEEVVSNG